MLSPTGLLVAFGVVGGLAALVWIVCAVVEQRKRPTIIYPDADLDQTCELNYRPE